MGRHLRVEGDHAPSGAVVVHHQIVYALHGAVGHDDIPYLPHQLRVGGLPQQGRQCLLGRLIGGKQDEQRHHKAHIAVRRQPRPFTDEHGQQHRRRSGGIGQAVHSRGLHGRGLDPSADAPVIQPHVQLHAHRRRQNAQRQRRERHLLRVEDFLKRGLGQLHAHQKDQPRHRKAGDILDASVAEGVVGVRLPACQPEAQQRHRRGARVRQVVEGVRRHGDGAGELSGKELPRKQQNIQDDAHHAAQRTVGPPHRRRRHIFPVRDQPPGQQSYHARSLLSPSPWLTASFPGWSASSGSTDRPDPGQWQR